MDTSEPLGLLLFIGTNIFGVYALYKIISEVYFYFKSQNTEEEF
jgi:hypothetical protein